MILIVEGSNRVGKTTFINELKAICDLNEKPIFVHDKRYVVNDNFLDIELTAEQMMRDANERHKAELNVLLSLNQSFPEMLIVLDRFHLSELVYGQVYRHYRNKGCIDLDKFLFEKDVLLLFIKSEYMHISDIEKKDLYLSIQNKMQNEYDAFYENKMSISFIDENDIKLKSKCFFESNVK